MHTYVEKEENWFIESFYDTDGWKQLFLFAKNSLTLIESKYAGAGLCILIIKVYIPL